MWIENNNNSIQNSNIGGYTNEDSKHGERKREKEDPQWIFVWHIGHVMPLAESWPWQILPFAPSLRFWSQQVILPRPIGKRRRTRRHFSWWKDTVNSAGTIWLPVMAHKSEAAGLSPVPITRSPHITIFRPSYIDFRQHRKMTLPNLTMFSSIFAQERQVTVDDWCRAFSSIINSSSSLRELIPQFSKHNHDNLL
jgi:hypothetical protein